MPLDETYLPEEVEMIEELKKFGLYEPIAIDCVASINFKEMDVVLTFLRRYGRMINSKGVNQ